MVTWIAPAGKTLYAATAPGAGNAVAMTYADGVYSAAVPDTWNVYEQAGAVPAAGDTAYTDLSAAAQLAADVAEVQAATWAGETHLGVAATGGVVAQIARLP